MELLSGAGWLTNFVSFHSQNPFTPLLPSAVRKSGPRGCIICMLHFRHVAVTLATGTL